MSATKNSLIIIASTAFLFISLTGSIATHAASPIKEKLQPKLFKSNFSSTKKTSPDPSIKRILSFASQNNRSGSQRLNHVLVQKQVVTQAIRDGDYQKFLHVASGKFLDRVNSEDKFANLVAVNRHRQEYHQQLEESVSSGNFDQFVQTIQSARAQIESVKGFRNKNNKPLSIEQLKQSFDDLRLYYDLNGKIPRRDLEWPDTFFDR